MSFNYKIDYCTAFSSKYFLLDDNNLLLIYNIILNSETYVYVLINESIKYIFRGWMCNVLRTKNDEILICGRLEFNNKETPLIKLNKDLSIDYNVLNNVYRFKGSFYNIEEIPNNKYLIVYFYRKSNKKSYYKLMKLNKDGSLDKSFKINKFNEEIYSVKYFKKHIFALGGFIKINNKKLNNKFFVKLDKNGKLCRNFKCKIKNEDYNFNKIKIYKNKLLLFNYNKVFDDIPPLLVDINGKIETLNCSLKFDHNTYNCLILDEEKNEYFITDKSKGEKINTVSVYKNNKLDVKLTKNLNEIYKLNKNLCINEIYFDDKYNKFIVEYCYKYSDIGDFICIFDKEFNHLKTVSFYTIYLYNTNKDKLIKSWII